jgi:hypothetical protein
MQKEGNKAKKQHCKACYYLSIQSKLLDDAWVRRCKHRGYYVQETGECCGDFIDRETAYCNTLAEFTD